MKNTKNYVFQQFIFTICLAVPAMLFQPQQLLAAEDTEPPVPYAISVSPTEIDVTAGSATVTFTISLTDNLSGFEYGAAYFYSPSKKVWRGTAFTPSYRTSGTATDGTYMSSINFPQYSEAGDWTLDRIMVRDVTQNTHNYEAAELSTMGLDSSISVTSVEDTTAPVLNAISFSPAAVNTSDGAASVTMNVSISDDISGYSHGAFTLYSPIYRQYRSFPVHAPNNWVSGDDYATTVSLPQYSESGDWYFSSASLNDKAGNKRYVDMNTFQATINVYSADQDVEKPVVEEFSITPLTINTINGPDTATIAPRITDNLSGLLTGSLYIASPSGGQSHYIPFGVNNRKLGGTELDGIYEMSKTLPQYSEYGEWKISSLYLRDNTSNQVSFTTADLEALGLPITLKVSGIISDGSGNYIIDSGGGTINTDDGILEVYFPAGAVGDGQEITITAVGEFDPVDIKIGTNVLGEGNVIAEYIFDPDGLTFGVPVTVTMTIDVTEFNQNKRDRLGVYLNVDTNDDGVEDTFDLIASTATTVTNSDDTVDMVFVFQLEHFSTYAVIEEIVEDTDPNTDTVPPTVGVTVPAPNKVIQGSVTLAATVTDDSSIKSASFTIREVNGEEGLIIGYENIPATQDTGTDNWILADFDSSQLLDGYYLIFATAKDASDNEGTSEVVSFSVRNWSLTELLPATKTNRPGRTMPVKFSMHLDYETDPSMPFVHNEELEIRIYEAGGSDLLQTSRFGVLSTDYRIDNVKEQYITNFKTSKTASEYLVEIWRISDSDGVEDVLIDELHFETKRKNNRIFYLN